MSPLIQRWKALHGRLKAMLDEYGTPALWSYVALALVWFVASYATIAAGISSQGVVASAGRFGAAYALYKLTMPFRVLVALVVVPLSARTVRRVQRGRQRTP